ncbi:uncharacterized protein LOC111106765 isoform X2 [Crassostrea virginica]
MGNTRGGWHPFRGFWNIYLIQIMAMHLVWLPCTCTFFYAGFCLPKDLMSFLRDENNCAFQSTDLSDICNENKQFDSCMAVFPSGINANAHLTIKNLRIKYYLNGASYEFSMKPPTCTSYTLDSLQNVEITMICEDNKAIQVKPCMDDNECDKQSEICHGLDYLNNSICIAKRHLHETCDHSLHCEMNSECRGNGPKRTCQCKEGHEEIDGRCIKGGLSLHGPCTDDQQCTGTENAHNCSAIKGENQSICRCNDGYIEINSTCYRGKLHLYDSCDLSEQCTGSFQANQCKYVDNVKICYCRNGYSVFSGECLKAEVVLGNPCYVDDQCIGTPNSTICTPDENVQLNCQCNSGFIEHKTKCIQANKTLYEECEIDVQCEDSSGQSVCKEIRGRRLCLCNTGYLEDKDTLTCQKVKKLIFESCDHDYECSATENANVCRTNADYGNMALCLCNNGYLEHKLTCIPGNLTLGQTCVHASQCTGTMNGRRCFEDKCTCVEGFLPHDHLCLHEQDNWILLIAGSGCLGMIVFVSVTVLVIRKRRQSCRMSSKGQHFEQEPIRNIRHSMANRGEIECGATKMTSRNNKKHPTENNYDKLHQKVEEEESDNLYDSAHPQGSYVELDSGNAQYSYNHLRNVQTTIQDSLYDAPGSVSMSSSTTDTKQDNYC